MIQSHFILRIILRLKRMYRQILAIGKEDRNKILYLGKQPENNHPLYFLWSIDSRYINSWILHGESMQFIWNILMETKPTTIIELGSGLSTLMLAKYAQIVRLNSEIDPLIYSIEHNQVWSNQILDLLEKYGLLEFIKLCLFPIKTLTFNGFQGKTYDITEIINHKYDFVLIDGPPPDVGRMLTLPSLIRSTSSSAIILIDDAQRYSEREAIMKWIRNYPFKIVFKGYIPLGTGLGLIQRI